ncbi:MAG: DUF5106 domain-containing protein [Rikenellaceae bacterium]|jgi:hypothetical protein|nr:DUF5106 domain-containing protein [Rikenellaceae bacterium]
MKKVAICCFVLFAACVCGGKKSGPAVGVQPAFRLPEVPAVYFDPAARATYLAAHSWESVDLADTAWVHNMDVLEKALPDYLEVLGMVNVTPDGTAKIRASYDALLSRAAAQPALRDSLTGLLEKYLYDPNSPMRNEDLYIPVLEAVIASPAIASLEKLRPQFQLEMALKNRPGRAAADFAYETADGRKGRLYGIKAPYTLLYLYNPECHGCEEIRAELLASRAIRAQYDKGGLAILALYVDEEQDVWRRHLDEIPRWWINARDAGCKIREAGSYDLRAIPTLYLLGASKEVILKDAFAWQVDAYIAGLQ